MALTKEQLQKLLDNPGMFSPSDMEGEDGSEQLLEEEAPEVEVNPEELLGEQEELAEPELVTEEDSTLEDLEEESPLVTEEVDGDLLAKLKKLKAGESIEDEEPTDEEAKDIANDATASTELRKKALQQIREKYLGKQ
jgi:hypothetical protein